jgi:hypothetical protein
MEWSPSEFAKQKKIDLSLVPVIGIAEEACAHLDGALKYGPFNWRKKSVHARAYVAACKRHLDLWLEGQEFTDDGGVANLGAARACLGIILDARLHGTLIDDRPIVPGSQAAFEKEIARINDWAKKRVAQKTP